MTRYYAIATVIVLTIGVIATAWTNRDLIRTRMHFTNLPVPPKARDASGGGGTRVDESLSGDAPWALSALPDCATEERMARGSPSFVRSKLPRDAVRIHPGTTLVLGACTILVGSGEVWVKRGSDRLRIPPIATLYRTAEGLALLRRSGKTLELRVYEPPTNRQE
jgi:hypothetical protein